METLRQTKIAKRKIAVQSAEEYKGTDRRGEIQKHRKNSNLIILFPTSEGVSEVSERAGERVSAVEGASEASSPEQTNE